MKNKISQTKIKNRMKRKTKPDLKETIAEARKHSGWKSLAYFLSGPTRNFAKINLFEIDAQTEEGDTIVIPGKVLSQGKLTKKVRIVALSVSAAAEEKLKETKSKFATILEEIKINPEGGGVKNLR